jgi:signal transduction histidine kinase
LRIAGVPYPLSELGEAVVSNLEFEPNQNHVQIDFFGMSFAVGETLHYQFKLEGADSDWSSPTDQRTVIYASLSPGSYRFLVRAVSADGTNITGPAQVTFKILPPLWQRWWFLTLAAIVVGLASHSIYRFRLVRLLELERVRTRIATDLHDDIGSSLSQIAVLSEVIRKRVGVAQNVSEPLTMIGRLSRDLVDSLSDIVWAINPKRDRLSDLMQRMRRYASDVFSVRDIEFNFDAPGPRQEISLGADLRREVFLIFKESINNIVRHSGCTRADLKFVIADGRLELSLHDNGKGFDPERVHEGNGLPNVRQRATKLGGSLEIISGNGHGTMVKLGIPLARSVWARR